MLIDGDVAHMLRHYFANPPRQESVWKKFSYEIMDKKGAMLKQVSYSSRLAQKFRTAQMECIEKYGAVGGFNVPIKDLSY